VFEMALESLATSPSSGEDYVVEIMRMMHAYAVRKNLNLTHAFQGASAGQLGNNTGSLHKEKFKMTLGVLFHQLSLPEEALDAIATCYEVNPGSQDSRWRQFAIDVRSLPLPDEPESPKPTDDLQQVFRELNREAKTKGLDLMQGFQGYGALPTGLMPKQKFATALNMVFHRYPLSHTLLAAILDIYGAGPPDSVNGGRQQILWRQFAVDVLSAN